MTDRWERRAGVSTSDEDETYFPGRDFLNGVIEAVRTLGAQTAFIGNSLGLYRRCGSALSR